MSRLDIVFGELTKILLGNRARPHGRFQKPGRSLKSGNVAILFSLVALPTLALVGFSVDWNRSVSMRAQMQSALDAATLAAAKRYVKDVNLNKHDREEAAIEEGENFFNQQIESAPFYDALTNLRVDFDLDDDGQLLGQVRANLATTIGALAGVDYVKLGVVSRVQAGSPLPLELAILLDNTGSMEPNIPALKTAAHGLVDAVTSGAAKDSVRISIVPYVTTVNVGPNFPQAYLDVNANSTHHGEWFENRDVARLDNCVNVPPLPPGYTVRNDGTNCFIVNPAKVNHFDLFKAMDNTRWKGCVESLASPYDNEDPVPNSAIPDTLYTPFFFPDALVTPYNNFEDGLNNYVPDDRNYWITVGPYSVDHIDDGPTNGRPQLPWIELLQYRSANLLKYSGTAVLQENGARTFGPNSGCPTQALPLTDKLKDINDAIDALTWWNGTGTQTQIGLSWGWKFLSPTPPFTEGLPYGEANKVIILMTDGVNEIVPTHHLNFSPPYDYDAPTITEYTGRGHVKINHFGVRTRPELNAKVNESLLATCQAVKAKGITIYTVVFNIPDQTLYDLYDQCASSPAHAYKAEDTAALIRVFKEISESIRPLRIVE